MDRREDRGAEERAGRHAEERERADEPEGTRPHRRFVQVGRGRRPDGHQHAAADRLDEARRDQLVEVLGEPGEHRSQHEDAEGRKEQPAGAPQVGEPAGQRHREDVHEQVPVDDPARLAQLDPGRRAVRRDQVGQDRRQRDRGDHQLETRQEHADAEHREQRERGSATHRGRV